MGHTTWRVWLKLQSEVYSTSQEVVVLVTADAKHAEAAGVRKAYRLGVLTESGHHTLGEREYVTVIRAVQVKTP